MNHPGAVRNVIFRTLLAAEENYLSGRQASCRGRSSQTLLDSFSPSFTPGPLPAPFLCLPLGKLSWLQSSLCRPPAGGPARRSFSASSASGLIRSTDRSPNLLFLCPTALRRSRPATPLWFFNSASHLLLIAVLKRLRLEWQRSDSMKLSRRGPDFPAPEPAMSVVPILAQKPLSPRLNSKIVCSSIPGRKVGLAPPARAR